MKDIKKIGLLLFLGCLSLVNNAQQTGMPIKVGASIDNSNQSNTEKKISVRGTIKGYPDQAKVYLHDQYFRFLDSTVLNNNKFELKVKARKKSSQYLYLMFDNKEPHKVDRRDVLVFILENTDIKIKGTKGNLKYSLITGGVMQNDYIYFRGMTSSLDRQLDDIGEAFSNAQAVLMKAIKDKEDKKVQLKYKKAYDSLGILQNKLIDKRIQFKNDFIKDYPDKLLSVKFLKGHIPLLSLPELIKFYDALSEENKNTSEGKHIAKWIRAKRVKLGSKAPDFTLASSDNKKYSLSDFKGKYVLIDFWESQCASCRIENKNLVKHYKKYKKKGLEIISVTADVIKEKWIEAEKKDGINWVSVINDPENDNALYKYTVTLIPTSFLVNPEGIVVAMNLRGQELADKLNEILK